MLDTSTMRYVVFHSSLQGENTPCISHVTKPDQTATMCGRRNWSTIEEPFDPDLGVDCLRCAKAVERATRSEQPAPDPSIRGA